ncbi:MAG: GGDEF domain-containing protein [Gammaproteobacteria bacterium]|nr:MAG: GGDEF domain-containing protein [Gammaproteobacteria bacterium]
MTEMQIRARTRSAIYAGATMLMFALALLNYKYGLFQLFYTAAAFIPIFAFGTIFSLIQLKYQLKETGHEIILTLTVVLIALRINQGHIESQHWLYPLGLMSFLVLSLKSANLFNAITLIFVSLLIAITENVYTGMRFFTSYLLLASIAGMFAYLHHHKTQSLVELTITDALTGVYNMKYFEDMLAKEVCRAHSTGHALSIISLQVDYLEDAKKLHGQLACNELMAELGKALKAIIRAGDTLYYSDQEKFYLLLPFTPAEGALVIAERIRRSIEETVWRTLDSITICIGSATLNPDKNTPDKKESAETLLDKAEKAREEAQKKGYNRIFHNDT